MTEYRGRDYAVPVLVLLTGLLATLVIWKYVDAQITSAEQLRFNRYSERVITTIQERLLDHERLLQGGRGLFYSSKSVEFDEWQTYVKAQNVELYPGILGLGYIYPVQRANLSRFVQDVRKQSPDFEVKTKGDFPDLFVITQIEPLARNRQARGLDIGQEANRRAAAEESVLSGNVTLTRRITLVQDQRKTSGFLMLLPLYRSKVVPTTLAERKRDLYGWVYVPIRIDELMSGVLEKTENMIDFEIMDGESDSKDDLIYDADKHVQNGAGEKIHLRDYQQRMFNKRHRVALEGRVWTVYTSTLPEFERTAAQAHWVIVAGALLSLAASLAMWSLVLARRRAQILAADMTHELRDSEARVHAIMDSVMDAIVVIDHSGCISSVNPATEHIFGYSAREMVGQNVTMLMPEPYRSEHAGYLQRYLETGQARIIGQQRELLGQRRNGEVFPMELAVSRIEIQGQVMFSGIVRDITERAKVDRLKKEFVSTVSHELRTPLTSIHGSLGLVAGGAVGELTAKMRQLIDIAYNNSERLIRLINDILDIEKIESGKMDVRLQSQALLPLIEQAVVANQSYAEQYQVRYVLRPDSPAVQVDVDADRLLQVLANLLSNAAKFSPSHGVVTIGVTLQEARVRITVTDQGAGIPEEYRDKIFQKFTQADSSDTRQKGGTGLGLAISKALIERMHGEIGFEVEAGVGTTFYLLLPLHRD